jgi:hypothetical protein
MSAAVESTSALVTQKKPKAVEATTKEALTAHNDEEKEEDIAEDRSVDTEAGKTPHLRPKLALKHPTTTMDPDGYGKPDENGITASEEFATAEGTESSSPVNFREGRMNNVESRNEQEKGVRPQSIEKLWRSLYPLVKLWWGRDGRPLDKNHKASVEHVQQAISSECTKIAHEDWKNHEAEYSKQMIQDAGTGGDAEPTNESLEAAKERKLKQLAESYKKQYRFPDKKFLAEITSINGVLAAIDAQEADQPAVGDVDEWEEYTETLQATKEKLLHGLAAMHVWLKTYKIDLGKVVSRTAHDTFMRVASESEDGKKIWGDAMKNYQVSTVDEEVAVLQKGTTFTEAGVPALKSPAVETHKTPAGVPALKSPAVETHKTPALLPSTNQTNSTASETALDAELERVLAQRRKGKTVIEPMAYDKGITEFGRHVATRLCKTGNPSFSRFVVNSGTEEMPHYKVIKGADVGLGAAAILEQNGNLQKDFDLRIRRAQYKQAPMSLSIGPCVIMPRSEGYVSREGKKSRRPDTYVRLLWKDGQEEWVSYTELCSLMGKKCTEMRLKYLEAEFYKYEEAMQVYRKHMLHPDTVEPLTEEDWKKMPWLFPDGQKPAEFSSPNHDAFAKKRTSISQMSDNSEL